MLSLHVCETLIVIVFFNDADVNIQYDISTEVLLEYRTYHHFLEDFFQLGETSGTLQLSHTSSICIEE